MASAVDTALLALSTKALDAAWATDGRLAYADHYNGRVVPIPPPTGSVDPSEDTEAMQDAIDNSEPGDRVFWRNNTGTDWEVNETINLPAERHYSMGHNRGDSIRAANGSNLHAVVAANGWIQNTNTTAASPIIVDEFLVDGNRLNQTSGDGHGFVSMNHNSLLHRIRALGCGGDGIRHTSATQNGTEISNTCVETAIIGCEVRSAQGTAGIYCHDASQNKLTDGWFYRNISASTDGYGFRLDSCAGWDIGQGNHSYGSTLSGLLVGRLYRTRVTNNYVESWGSSASSGVRCGIDAYNVTTDDGGSPSVISGNCIDYTTGAGSAPSGTTLIGIALRVATGGDANVYVGGNSVYGLPHTATTSIGVRFTCQDAGGTLHTNPRPADLIRGWDTAFVQGGTGTFDYASWA